jgi:mannosyltransferase
MEDCLAITADAARSDNARLEDAQATPWLKATAVLASASLAAILVVRRLGTKPLWLDETVSVSVASRPLSRLLSVLPHHDANAGLYYLLLHGWMRLGHGAGWVRGPSAMGFVATAGLAAWIGNRWRGPWLGLACGLLVATNPFLLFYGQEARPYAIGVLLAVGSTAALFWRQEEPAPGPYVALTAALLYVDLFAVLFLVSQALAVLVVHRWSGTGVPRVLIRCWLAVAAITAPLALVMVLRELSQISWLTSPTGRYLGQTVTAMTAGWLGLSVMAALSVVGLLAIRRRGPRYVGARGRLVLPALLAAFIIPPPLLWLVSQVVPSFIDRYVICSTVAVIGLAGFGLEVVRQRAGGVVALAILIVLAGLGGQRIAADERKPFKYEDPPAVVTFIEHQTQPGDAVGYSGGGLRTVIDAYRPPGAGLPADIAVAPGGEARRQSDLYAREVSSATLEQRLTGVDRVWLITDPTNRRYPPDGPFAALRTSFGQAFRPTTAASFPGIDVTLYVRRVGP